jgi:hypothetical protein
MMKRTCYDCRALEREYSGHGTSLGWRCQLRKEIQLVRKRGGFGFMDVPVPAELCPKPRTIPQFTEAYHAMHQQASTTAMKPR